MCEYWNSTCELNRGNWTFLQISFKPNRDIKNVTLEGYVIAHGVSARINTSPKVCTNQFVCPLVPQQTAQFKRAMQINRLYPLTRINTKWVLFDDNHKEMICVVIPVEIKPEGTG